MQILKQSAKLLNISHNDPLLAIEEAGRTCYMSEVKDSKEFVSRIIRRGHESVLEHISVTLELITNLKVLGQLSRHRLISLSVESSRYVNYKDGITVILPVEFYDIDASMKVNSQYWQWLEAMKITNDLYNNMILNGAAPQLASNVLPKSTKTKIIMTCNLRELRHIFDMRLSSGSDPQIRELFNQVLVQVKEQIPVVFDEYNV